MQMNVNIFLRPQINKIKYKNMCIECKYKETNLYYFLVKKKLYYFIRY